MAQDAAPHKKDSQTSWPDIMRKATVVAGYPSLVLGQEYKQNPIIHERRWGFLFVRGSGLRGSSTVSGMMEMREHDAIVPKIIRIVPLPKRMR